MRRLQKLSSRLSDASIRNYNNPYTSIKWPEALDPQALCFSSELVSINELDIYKNMSDIQKIRVALFEAINFFSLNISGERELISGLSTRMYKKYPEEITDYIHHFVDEENKHMIWFGTFSEKYGGKIYPDKKVVFPRQYAKGEEDFLFFSKVVIFEEIVDQYNIFMAEDERLDPLVRQINYQHHEDESRHLGFGREIALELYNANKPHWNKDVIDGISEYLKSYMVATWREYFNPAVYTDCGLDNSYEVMTEAWDSKKEFRMSISKKCLEFFQKNEIILDAVEL